MCNKAQMVKESLFRKVHASRKVYQQEKFSTNVINKRVMRKKQVLRIAPLIFLINLLLGSLVLTFIAHQSFDTQRSDPFVLLLWLVGFAFLTPNVIFILQSSLVSLFKGDTFPKVEIDKLQTSVKVTIAYFAKHEDLNQLETFMSKTILHNGFALGQKHVCDFFLVSNSDDPAIIAKEKILIQKLNEQFSEMNGSVKYFQATPPKHIGFQEFINAFEYDYVLPCDADTMILKSKVIDLVSRAEHLDNQDIAVFQTALFTIENETVFAKWMSFGQDLSQRLYSKSLQKIFGSLVFYGSGALIRVKHFRQISIPKHIRSHDICETAALSKLGYRTVFCHDIITYEMFPKNYLDVLTRDSRWASGTFQAWRYAFEKNVSPGCRFFILLPIYMYVSQPVFLIWLALGVYFNDVLVIKETFIQVFLFIFVMAVVAGHRFLGIRSLQEVYTTLRELVISTLINVNGVIYTTLAVIYTLFHFTWEPTPKSYQMLPLKVFIKNLWPTTLIGFILAIISGTTLNSFYFFLLPFTIGFTFIIPIAYFTHYRIDKPKAVLKKAR